MNRLFCFGVGYCAKMLGRRLKAKGWALAATGRSVEKVNHLTNIGYEAFRIDERLLDPATALRGTTHIFASAPPIAAGDPFLAAHERDLTALSPRPQWLGYLSALNVYGDHQGKWVDETAPTHPTNERAKRLVAAEQAWLAWGVATSIPVQIFRLAGVYGPRRNPFMALREGTARRIAKQGHVASRVHIDDVVTVIEASMARPHAGAIYNVCDDEPAPPQEIVEHAAKLLNIAPPPLESYELAAPSMTDVSRSFFSDVRRVKNDRIKNELGVTLRYPSYREGLKALLAANS